MEDLEKLTLDELHNMIWKIEKEIFERKKKQRIENLKQTIKETEEEKFEECNRFNSSNPDEFDSYHNR